jgi:flagellar basal body-associated protein FliL
VNLELWRERALWTLILVCIVALFCLGMGAGYWTRVCR